MSKGENSEELDMVSIMELFVACSETVQQELILMLRNL